MIVALALGLLMSHKATLYNGFAYRAIPGSFTLDPTSGSVFARSCKPTNGGLTEVPIFKDQKLKVPEVNPVLLAPDGSYSFYTKSPDVTLVIVIEGKLIINSSCSNTKGQVKP